MKAKTIKQDTVALLTRKRPLTYTGIVGKILELHPGSQTSVSTVQWYASRLRAQGLAVNVKRENDRRDWTKRVGASAEARAVTP